MLGRNVWRGRYPIVWGGELIESKSESVLKETRRSDIARPAGGAGGVQCDPFGCDRAQLM